jgi:hypothetical protein
MLRTIFIALGVVLVGAHTVQAQEIREGAGRLEINAFPGGGMVFKSSSTKAEPDFTNYAVGGSLTLNFNRWLGVEGEVGNAPGVHQTVQFNGERLSDQHTPCMLVYNANMVVSPWGNDHPLVPYATGGVGGLTLLDIDEVANLGVTARTTYPTGSVGGGLKWFASRHWGLRADYRMFVVMNKDTAPQFFGREENRYGHRVYGGVLFTY